MSSDTLPTAERFIQMLTRSGLFERDELRRILEEVPKPIRRDTQQLSDYLVEKQILTHFQATKLSHGTYQGLVLGPYQVLTPLGRGGMGAVYLARNTAAKQGGSAKTAKHPALVALKVLPPKRAKEEERTLARFLREMDMCQRVGHPHLTQTFDAGQIEGVYFIAMEYIRGISLSQFVKANGPLPPSRAARLFAEIASGLAHAHEIGLIHRDLKPSNIMVTPNGHGKVLDLGLALAVDEDLPKDKMIVGGQGYVVGTMDYIAPEQVDDPSQVDARADLYSLGCTMYFALTGQPPFTGGTSLEKMKRHRTEFAEPITDFNPTVPIDFARIVEKLMEKKPGKRFRSADQVRDALLPWTAGDPETPMDTDPHYSESEAIEQLEKEQSAEPGLWWESVPGISFEATAKYSGHHDSVSTSTPEAEETAPEKKATEDSAPPKSNPFIAISIIIGVLIGVVVLLEMIRR